MLDYDGFGHIAALEQNFNPSNTDIERRTKLGIKKLVLCHFFISPPVFIFRIPSSSEWRSS